MNNKCNGCGAILQNTNPNEEGYYVENETTGGNICRRCFRIKNYGDYMIVDKNNQDYYKILNEISGNEDLVLVIVDLTNINENLTNIINYFDNPVMVVFTKRDLLPKSVNNNKLLEYFEPYNKNVVDYIIISSMNNYNLDSLIKKIRENKTSNYVHVVGNTNAGKSTLINKLLKNYTSTEPLITTSFLPSTTVSQISLKIDDSLTLVDTPGLLDENNIINNLYDMATIKSIIPRKEIKPTTYQMNANKSIVMENLVRINYVDGDKNSFTIYASNLLDTEVINIGTNKEVFNKCDRHIIEVRGEEDVVINGLCWIKITKHATLEIFTIKGVSVFTRKSLI